jgi:hypothetical protein
MTVRSNPTPRSATLRPHADGWLRPALAGALLLAAGVLATAPAAAQTRCAVRADIVKQLDKGFTETRAGWGLTNQGRLLELYRAKDGATWTLLLTHPNGTSCLIGAGESWIDAIEAVKGPVS